MSTIKKKITKTDILEVQVQQLQEDVVEIRSDISVLKKDVSNIKHHLNNMDDKLDKILDTVSDNQGKLHQRVTILEHHTTHPPVILSV
ncbi:MAG: hypothetical protein UX62_C0044G0012 [Microgenomates group bacterium GW2011_GWA2_46_7]|nr:MAG: hypothetical protein UX62_C0044G0012 [Microgenomates group bacterium GW2011_GWA2_46_7]